MICENVKFSFVVFQQTLFMVCFGVVVFVTKLVRHRF